MAEIATSPRKASAPPVTALVRADRILEAVALAEIPPTAAVLARTLRLPKSTTLGLCATLTELGLLDRGSNGTFTLGRRMFALSRRFAERLDLTQQFVAVTRELEMPEESTVTLGLRDGRHTVTIAERPGLSIFGYRIGRRSPAHATAMGKAMLSLISEEDLQILYRGVDFEILTQKTVESLERLLAELSEVRAQGYAIDEEETAPGMVCIGAPITIPSGHLGSVSVGAVALSFRKETATKPYRDKAIEYIQQFAANVSERIV